MALAVLEPAYPKEVLQAIGTLANTLSTYTTRPPDDFIRPLSDVVQTMWVEAHRQRALGIHKPLQLNNLKA
jgi:hypothetical protein